MNGSSGTSMWTTSSLSIPKDAYAAGDVDSDERVEIIIVDVASPGIVALNGADGSTRWTRGITGGISGSPFVTDLADDGTVEVLVGTTTGSILSLSGYDGTIQWTTTINTVAVKIKAIGDVDEDTYPDIVCTSSSQLYVISGASHSIMWTSSFTITSGYDTEVAISDVNNDGIAELIIHDSALLRVVNARTGITSWSANVNSQPGLQIADINTDGLEEIFICASTRYLESISGDGLVTTVFPFEGHGSTITDLNNDGNLELIFGYLEIYGRAGGYLYSHLKCRDLLEYATSVNFYGQPGPWPCVRGSTLRTNAYLDTDHDNLSNDLERCIGTSLTLYDTDLDILSDGFEVQHGTNPLHSPFASNISLTAGSVTPTSGSTSTVFQFFVTYTSGNNIAPYYIRVNINGTNYYMNKKNATDITYTDGCVYTCSCTLPPGNYSYYFTGGDGYTYLSTSSYAGPAVTNVAPTLAPASVSPSSGTTSTTFTFTVTYTDADNNAPSYVYVYIDGYGYSMSKQDSGDVVYTDGCIYVYNRTLAIASHNYFFHTSDGYATTTTTTCNGPTVTNVAPTLAPGSVSPSSGTTSTTFTFTVTYTDADNNAPSYVRVYIDGTYYSMSKQNGDDYTYTDGCIYVYSRTLAIASHNYFFYTSDGYATNTTSTYQGPTVTAGPNQSHVLSAASVTPTSGTTSTMFTYAIVYSDPNDDAPSHVRVIIDDITFAMVKQNPADTTYTDGCTYVFST
ncbi:MAG: PQQ-binding-like beta-propeller repeat protein, partial [Candidatus Lokiarchaeota archaeon]|nr:PQQ-binding-like beta-propeller repeat protein [Candidatus Lokiarchaeota archaeon]